MELERLIDRLRSLDRATNTRSVILTPDRCIETRTLDLRRRLVSWEAKDVLAGLYRFPVLTLGNGSLDAPAEDAITFDDDAFTPAPSKIPLPTYRIRRYHDTLLHVARYQLPDAYVPRFEEFLGSEENMRRQDASRYGAL